MPSAACHLPVARQKVLVEGGSPEAMGPGVPWGWFFAVRLSQESALCSCGVLAYWKLFITFAYSESVQGTSYLPCKGMTDQRQVTMLLFL